MKIVLNRVATMLPPQSYCVLFSSIATGRAVKPSLSQRSARLTLS
jgi:hypothetical protein